MVKAQVHSCARGKGEGIVRADTPGDAQTASSRLLGTRLISIQTGPEGLPVHTILLEQFVVPVRKLFLRMFVDPSHKRPVLIAGAHASVDAAQLTATDSGATATVAIDPLTGLLPYQVRSLARALDLSGPVAIQAAQVMRALYHLFIDKDCSLAEIDPLVVTASNELLALDVNVMIDDSALYRQPEIVALRDDSQLHPLEQQAARAGVSYVKLDGAIGCLVNGAGLGMATMDLVTVLGGRPANFLDIGGTVDETTIRRAIELLLDDGDVRVALINIFGGVLRCDTVARALLQVLNERHSSIPFVVRMQGTNAREAGELLISGPMSLMLEPDLGRAARLAVATSGTTSHKRRGPAS